MQANKKKLSRWLEKGQLHKFEGAANKALTDSEELQLAGWIRARHTQIKPAKPAHIKTKVRQLLQLRMRQLRKNSPDFKRGAKPLNENAVRIMESTDGPSNKWLRTFYSRHPKHVVAKKVHTDVNDRLNKLTFSVAEQHCLDMEYEFSHHEYSVVTEDMEPVFETLPNGEPCNPPKLKTTVCPPELCVYSTEHLRFQSGDPAFTAKCVEGAHSQPNCNC